MSQNNREKRPFEASVVDQDQNGEPVAKRPYLESSKEVESISGEALEKLSASGSGAPIECVVDICGVKGLLYYPNFVDEEEERQLLAAVEAGVWDNSLKRRVQHFGLRYDYSAKSVDRNAEIVPLPAFLEGTVSKIHSLGQFYSKPDQCIVNEYTPGQGINPHIDRVDSFGATVASLSLQSAVIMVFSLGSVSKEVLLEPRSLVILTGDARYKWKHSIAPRKTDRWNGEILHRDRRVSLTFRTVKASLAATSSSSSSSSAPKSD